MPTQVYNWFLGHLVASVPIALVAALYAFLLGGIAFPFIETAVDGFLLGFGQVVAFAVVLLVFGFAMLQLHAPIMRRNFAGIIAALAFLALVNTLMLLLLGGIVPGLSGFVLAIGNALTVKGLLATLAYIGLAQGTLAGIGAR